MKKLIAAAIAFSMIGTSAMAAPYYGGNNDRGHVERSDRGHGSSYGTYRGDNGQRFDKRNDDRRYENNRYNQNRYHQWRKGERFERSRAMNYRVIGSPRDYRLYNAPRGYHWVRSGNDAVLVGITSGIVSAIIANAIR